MTEQNSSENTSMPGEERRQTQDHDTYFNAQFDAEPRYVEPGGVNMAENSGEMLVGTVGSGVLLTIYDQELKLGSMGYVILPDAVLDCFPFLDQADQALVDAAFAPIEAAVNGMKRRGAGKARIRIRLFGGVIRDEADQDRGLKNTVFVQEYLYRKGLQVYNADIGGRFIRRVHFFPTTGQTVRRLLKRQSDFTEISAVEANFNKNITSGA